MPIPLHFSRGGNLQRDCGDWEQWDGLKAGGSWYEPWKAVVEYLLVLCLLVPAIPVIALLALLVKLTSRGPAFYAQTRLGRHGRPYRIFKMRSMYAQCERVSGPCWSVPGDPRVTPLGRFMRRTHLDELPQLLNVLRGEMSLVGPRPERPEFVPELERALPHYRQRLLIRPGVTGLAQIQLPGDTDLESVRRKLAYDLYYIHSMSPWLDLRIVAGTALKVLGVSFALLRTVLWIPSRDLVERIYRQRAARGTLVVHPIQPSLAT